MKTTLRSILLSALLVLAGISNAGATGKTVVAMQPPPDFTLRTIDGPNLRLGEQRGRVVMVNFWATWCGPCRVELPHLNTLHQRYSASGFRMLGVNIDEDPRKAAELATKLGIQFPTLLDTQKLVSKSWDLSTMPSTVLIDRSGRVRHVHLGYRDGYENTYEQQIRALLKE
jgi:peroxiredoxin